MGMRLVPAYMRISWLTCLGFGSVNLGGWFVLEPFITPALFQKYNGTVDEWSLSIAMRADEAGGGIDQIKQHYETFYVRTMPLLRVCAL